MKNFAEMMKQAKQMQSQLHAVQKELEQLHTEGSSKDGSIQMVLNGKHLLQSIKIDSTLLQPENKAVLEKKLLDTFNETIGKIEQLSKQHLQQVTANLKLPDDAG